MKDPAMLAEAHAVFEGTALRFTTAGKRHLGAALGSHDFRREYASEKVQKWCDEVTKLAEFAVTQPHAAFAAFIHGEQHRFRYFMRTIPGMEEYLKPLDDVISHKLLPAIFGTVINNDERELFSLPIREGGLGVPILAEIARSEFITSTVVNAPLAAIMVLQGTELPDEANVREITNNERRKRSADDKVRRERITANLPPATLRAVQESCEKGASNWLSVRPSEEHGFVLNKSDFRDAVSLRYNRPVKNLPSTCACGQSFDVTHAMNCKKGGYVTIRHNDIRDFEAGLLSKVCSDVQTEPPLQPVTGEILAGETGDEARPDVRARGFWRRGQNAFFDVCVTNANAKSHASQPIRSALAKYERAKKNKYNQRIMNIEHGTLTPLVFTVNGSMGPECAQYHKCLADKIAQNTGEQYADVISFMRCKLSYIVLRSAILCLRGSRSKSNENLTTSGDDFGLYVAETHLER